MIRCLETEITALTSRRIAGELTEEYQFLYLTTQKLVVKSKKKAKKTRSDH